MPSLKASAVELDPARYRQVNPVAAQPVQINPAPAQPSHLLRAPVMISSLPSISTAADGIYRQFYGGRAVPTRRLALPK